MIDSQENVLAPRTLWAQNKHQVFLTFEIFEGKDIKVEFEKDKVRFSGVQSDSNQKYEVELELYENIVPDNCSQHYTPRTITCALEKASEGPFWPRLVKTKSKPHFIHVDFSRWVDENENEDEEDPMADAPLDPNMFMNFAGGAGQFGGDDHMIDEAISSEDDDDAEEMNAEEEMPALEHQ